MPSIPASKAALIVPEYITLIDEFEPWLIPETHKSGRLSKICFTASFTQSAGVPEQLYSV